MSGMWLAGIALLAAGIYTRSARRSLVVALVGVLALAATWVWA